jgi:hypothetical protein
LTVYAFFSPVLRFAPLPLSLLFGVLVGSAIMAAYWGTIYLGRWDGKIWAGAAVILGLASLTAGLALHRVAMAGARSNAARCYAIQVDMLSAHPRRSDSPDLFQALGCQPSGNGGVSAPPTDREKKAGRALPWGGYPPSL